MSSIYNLDIVHKKLRKYFYILIKAWTFEQKIIMDQHIENVNICQYGH